MMVDKPSYNELVHRIQALETENSTLCQDLSLVKRSENKFRMMIENIPDIVWTLSTDELRTEYISPSVEPMLGYTIEEAKKKSIKEMLTPASFKLASQYFADGLKRLKANPSNAQQPITFEMEYICKDGSSLWIELTAKPVFDEKGNVIDIIGVSRDISKRLIAEIALKKSAEKYRTLFENSRDAIYITTINGKMSDFNPAGIALFGYTRQEIIDSDILIIYDNPEDREKFQKTIREKDMSGTIK